jgi:hypothetical protein
LWRRWKSPGSGRRAPQARIPLGLVA